jgi:hypothetical protein
MSGKLTARRLMLTGVCIMVALLVSTGLVSSMNTGVEMAPGTFSITAGGMDEAVFAARVQGGDVRPLSMATADFDGDDVPDLVCGYEGAGGVITLRKGNAQAAHPTTEAAIQGVRESRFAAPFLPGIRSISLPEAPEFLAAGDVDGDSHADLLAAARGSSRVYLLRGDGTGKFAAPKIIELAGIITSMASADVNESDGLADLVVAVSGADGPVVQVYQGTHSGLATTPLSYSLPQPAVALATGRVGGDDGRVAVLAASGNEVLVLRGPNEIEHAVFPFSVRAVAVGQFIWDRAGRAEIAALSEDGTIQFATRGEVDRRQYSQAELDMVRAKKLEIGNKPDRYKLFSSYLATFAHEGKNTGWLAADTIKTGALSLAGGAQPFLVATRISNTFANDLIVADSATQQLRVVKTDVTDVAARTEVRNLDSVDGREDSVLAEQRAPMKNEMTVESIDAPGAPVAVLPMKLNLDTKTDLVVLRLGTPEPLARIEAINATFDVDTNTDSAAAAQQVCSAAANDCSLRGAIIKANAANGDDIITFNAGTNGVACRITLANPDLVNTNGEDFEEGLDGYQQGFGDFDIADNDNDAQFDGNLTLTGNGTGNTIIEGGTSTAAAIDRVFDVNNFVSFGTACNVSFQNMTVRFGQAKTGKIGGNFYDGGGIKIDGFDSNPNTGASGDGQGTLTLSGVNVTQNQSSGQGGGVHTISAFAVVNSSSSITQNTTVNSTGGGLNYAGGNTNVNGQTLTLSSATISNNNANQATFGNGAGFATQGGAGVTLTNCTISNNNSNGTVTGDGTGGGGAAFQNSPNISITGGSITGNHSNNNGGGLWVSARNSVTNAASTLTINNVTITGNTADNDNTGAGNGGGIYAFFGNITIGNSSAVNIDGNSAVNGGGIFATWSQNTNDNPVAVTMTGGTIGQAGGGNGNNAKNNGGGVAIQLANSATTPKTSNFTLTNTTLTNNTANSDSTGGGDGGAFFQNGNDANFRIFLLLDGVNASSNIANSGTGDGILLSSGGVTCSNTVTFGGDDSVSIAGGTFTSTVGTLNIAGNFTQNGGTFTHNSGTVNFNGGGAQAINGSVATKTFNNLTVNKAAGVLSGGASTTTLTLAGNLTLTNGTLDAGTATTINVGGNWTQATGTTFTPGSGTVVFNGAGAQNIDGTLATKVFNNFTVNKGNTLSGASGTTALDINGNLNLTAGTFAAGTAAAINLAGNWTQATGSTFTPGSGTVTFDGGAAQSIDGTLATKVFNNFTVNKGGGTLSGAASTTGLNITGTVTLTAGTFAPGTATAIAMTTGDWTNNGGVFTPGTSVVTFSNAVSGQNINGTAASQTFNSITVNKTAQTLAVGGNTSTLNLNGTMTLTSGTFNVGTAANVNVGGDWTNNGGTFTPGSGTVTFNGGGAQNVNGSAATQTFNNFGVNKSGGTLSGAGSTTTLNVNDLSITAGTFAAGTIATLNVAGNWANAGTFIAGSSTVVFNGNNNTQTLTGSTTFNNLTSNHTGTGGVTASGSTLVVTGLIRIQSGTFTSSSTFNNVQIDATTTLAGTNGATMNVSGNWTNNGTFTPNNNIVNFNGNNNTQTIGGLSSTSFDNMTSTHTGTGGITLGIDATVNTLLTLTSGNITTGLNTLNIGAAGSITRTSGHVIGALKKFSVPATFTFHVGTASGYTPMALSNVTGGGDLSVMTNTPQQPLLNAATSLHEYWTLTQTGTLSGDMTFSYLAADVFGNEALYRIWRVNAPTAVTFENAATCPASGSPCVNPGTHTAILNGVGTFAVGPTFITDWTVGQNVTSAANGTVLGRITTPNGDPVAGAVVNLSGTQTRKTITDAQGNYRFDGVETTGFYTVTPSRANFNFVPVNRSFNQLAERTEAAFTGAALPDQTNPVDTAEFFVRQQYVDVLGREPDEGGFNYWSNQILGCGSDATCINSRRRDVAAAFFIEAEFQRTGSFVYGLYKGALGRQPIYQEFASDRQIVVDGPNLDQVKQAFAENFVGRSEFVAKYAANANADSFVDALLNTIRQTSGVDLIADRSNLINVYNSESGLNQSRAAVLRAATESAAFRQAEYNPAFVLTEYFAYLRRDPEPAGYAFWLDVLNTNEAGNYRGMVCGFVTSAEYQRRFSGVVSRTDSSCVQ